MSEMASLHEGIKSILDREGSDKGRWYGGLYEQLLEPVRLKVEYVLEIGIGTMLPDAPSSMVEWAGENYRPGASLRAWRDYFPNATVHGIDPAPDTEIKDEPRIVTHCFDSRDAASTSAFFDRWRDVDPDLIVDDGLHEVDAQIATMENFLPHLKAGGLYVVEDVSPEHVQMISTEISRISPKCIFAPDSRPEPWVAIVIRKPLDG